MSTPPPESPDADRGSDPTQPIPPVTPEATQPIPPVGPEATQRLPPLGGDDQADDDRAWVPLSPLEESDPPRVGGYWLDARLETSPAGTVYTAHDEQGTPVMLVLLSQGAAADAAARDRLAGIVNRMHIDTVLARGGQGQDFGRMARRYRADEDTPVAPDERPPAPWAALAYDGSPAAAAEARRILDEVELAAYGPQGRPAGPDYTHYWHDRIKPGLARLWPLPWPGRRDRAGWRTIFVSWLLMLLLAALAVLIAILIFRNQPPQTVPPPTGGSGSGSPPPQSSSPSPESGSPTPSDGSGSPSESESASPSQSGPESGSPSPSGSESGSESPSESGSPSPSGSESGGGGGETPSESASAAPSSPSRL